MIDTLNSHLTLNTNTPLCREKFNVRALHQHGKTYHLQGWFKRFVEKVGVERSKVLMKGAGVIDIIGTNN